MKYTSIYKNGKVERFFIKIESPKEFEILRPYFLVTTHEKRRHGNILEMDVLFSGEIWQGRQTHGYGYSSSADVYNELIHIILKTYNKKGRGGLSTESAEELRRVNTHDDTITFSEKCLDELRELNSALLEKRLESIGV
jgi:hypothetical protein